MGGSSQPYTMAPSMQATSQTRDPWGAAIPALQKTLGAASDAFDTTYTGQNVASMDPNVTASQDAILANSANGAVSGGANSALGGVRSILDNLGLSSQQQQGAGAIGGALGNLSPMASGAMLDPSNDPNFQKSLQDSLDQSANTVNAQFSQAGRYGSGAQTDTLARTLGNVATNAYSNRYAQNEQNMLSANAQTGSLAGQLAGIGQSSVGNLYGAGSTLQGLGTAQNLDASNQGTIGGQRMDYAQQQIDAANQSPWTRVGNLAQIASGIGGLGGTSSGTSIGYQPMQNTQPSALQSIIGGLSTAAGTAARFYTPSDERLKEDIERIGRTDDGQNLYSYRYKSGGPTQIGLLAQEVEKHRPEAVATDPASGMKMVNYDLATRKRAA